MSLCLCGCGKRVKPGNLYINGHNMRGKKRPELSGENHPFFGKRRVEHSKRMSGKNNPMYGKKRSKRTKEKLQKANIGKTYDEKFGLEKALKIKNKKKLTISKIRKRYPFFSQIEEMRYNPDKPEEKEIQVHCKNHSCENSKEKSGWFTPTRIQLSERIRQLENVNGNGGCYFYCSEKCKDECPLFNLQNDPYSISNKPYTQQEYETFKKFVLERDNYKCQYCGKLASEVHHERPQKLEPFFALDPDLAWSVCKKCHYKYGHKTGTECSTGNLAVKICL